jgi:SAM-dependent methyltransferase
MRTKSKGLPLKIDPNRNSSRIYEGVEYKDFWDGDSKSKLDELEHSLLRKLIPQSGRRIIDVGCGFGRLANCYLDRFEQVVMLDGSMTLLRQAQDSIKDRATYIAADANHLPFARSSFNCILMFRVFHHLADSQAILMEFNRVLGNMGTLVFNYCNKLSARRMAQWLIRFRRENPFSLEPVGIGTRFIIHHPDYVHRALENAAFSDIRYLGSGVMDKLVSKSETFNKWLPTGEAIAPFLGVVKIAPWINCRAVAHGEELDMNKSIEELLACPICHSSLQRSVDFHKCSSCGKSYPIVDNIADFRFS